MDVHCSLPFNHVANPDFKDKKGAIGAHLATASERRLFFFFLIYNVLLIIISYTTFNNKNTSSCYSLQISQMDFLVTELQS